MRLKQLAIENVHGELNLVNEAYAQALTMADSSHTSEVNKFTSDYARYTDKINHAMESVTVAQGMIDALNQQDSNVGMTASEARVIMTATEGLRVSLGHRRGSKRSMSAESISDGLSNQTNLKLAKEGLVGFIGDVIKAIFRIIAAIGNSIINFFKWIFGFSTSASNKAESIRKKADEVDKKLTASKLEAKANKIYTDAMDKSRTMTKYTEITARLKWEAGNIVDSVTSGKVLTSREKKIIEDKAFELVKKHSPILGSFGPSYNSVRYLALNNKPYKDAVELQKWITDLFGNRDLVNTLEYYNSHIEEVMESLKDTLNSLTESDDVIENKVCSLLRTLFGPVVGPKLYMDSRSEHGLVEYKSNPFIGGHSLIAISPSLADKDRADLYKTLHLASFRMKSTSQMVEGLELVPPYLSLSDAKDVSKHAEKLLEIYNEKSMSAFKELEGELAKKVKEYENKLKNDPDSIKNANLPLKLMSVFGNVFVAFVTTVYRHFTNIVDNMLLLASSSVHYYDAIAKVTIELTDYMEKNEHF